MHLKLKKKKDKKRNSLESRRPEVKSQNIKPNLAFFTQGLPSCNCSFEMVCMNIVALGCSS